MQGKISADHILKYFSYFFQNIEFNIFWRNKAWAGVSVALNKVLDQHL